MLKIRVCDIEKFAAERNWPPYQTDLLSAGLRIPVRDGDYLLIAADTYQFFAHKYTNFAWPNAFDITQSLAQNT